MTNTIIYVNEKFEIVEPSSYATTQQIACAISCDFISALSQEISITYAATTTMYSERFLESKVDIVTADTISQSLIITVYDKAREKYGVQTTALQPVIIKYKLLTNNINYEA